MGGYNGEAAAMPDQPGMERRKSIHGGLRAASLLPTPGWSDTVALQGG